MTEDLSRNERIKEASDYLRGTLAEGLRAAATGAGVPHQLNRVGSMWTLFFTPDTVRDLPSASASDKARFARFFWEMMDRGVYLPCSQFEAAFLNTAMTDEQIAQTITAARESFRAILA